jgi:hypothetical protein
MSTAVKKWEWIAGFVFTFGLVILGIANRTIDRVDGRWTLFEKSLSTDGKYYLFQSQRYRGLSVEGAIKSVTDVFGFNSFGLGNINDVSMQMVETRPIYPFLTSLLGPASEYKLMIVPIVSWILINFLLFFYLVRTFHIFAALTVYMIISSSFYFRYNLLATTTDALALLLILPYLYICVSKLKNLKFYAISFFAATLSLFVRPTAPFLILVSCSMLLLSKSRLDKIFHLLIIFLSSIHLLYLEVFENQITIQSKAHSTSFDSEFLISVVTSLPKIIITEFAFLATNDTLLFVLIILGLLSSVMLDRRHKVLMVMVFLACFLSAGVNGTMGNGFRYQLPIIITVAPMTLLFLQNYLSKKFYLNGTEVNLRR